MRPPPRYQYFDSLYPLDSLPANVDNLKKVRELILSHLEDTDYNSLTKDLRPFLQYPNEAEKIKIFTEFLKQELN